MEEIRRAIVLLGPPGSGKTTLARALATSKDISLIEMGNLLADEIRRDSALGRQIKPYKAKGELVPADLVEQVLSVQLKEVDGKVFLFDGFPRSSAQVEMLFRLLKLQGVTLSGVVILNVDLDTALKRITGRRICQGCGAVYNVFTKPPGQDEICDRCGGALVQREDDRIEVVKERFLTYERETGPVLAYFRKEFPERTLEESAAGRPEQVLQQVRLRLQPILRF